MSDETYLVDMLNAARRAMAFVESVSADEFESSDLHQSAVVKQLEIIGEAARRVSEEFRLAHPEVPWKLIVGMRHRLVHDYTRIDVPTVWETAQRDLAPLVEQLESYGIEDPGVSD